MFIKIVCLFPGEPLKDVTGASSNALINVFFLVGTSAAAAGDGASGTDVCCEVFRDDFDET